MEKPERQLSPKEQQRLARLERMQQNRRGRNRPASVPARLTRTSAFTPKRRGLITDANFKGIYVVPNHSVVEVSGRELGSQHRDAMDALFRVPETRRIRNSSTKKVNYFGEMEDCTAHTTWRELLNLMNRQEHVNNLLTLLSIFEDIKKVVMTVYEGDPEAVLAAKKRGVLVGHAGRMGSIINDIEWQGVDLDSCVTITYGAWTASMMQKAHLVSLNADVQFALKSDHAKCFWPYIDSQNGHHFVDGDLLAALAGRDLWGDGETAASRSQFRKDCRQAFNDMVRAGGLSHWEEKVTGTGRKKSRRYVYQHALRRQMELKLNDTSPLAESGRSRQDQMV